MDIRTPAMVGAVVIPKNATNANQRGKITCIYHGSTPRADVKWHDGNKGNMLLDSLMRYGDWLKQQPSARIREEAKQHQETGTLATYWTGDQR